MAVFVKVGNCTREDFKSAMEQLSCYALLYTLVWMTVFVLSDCVLLKKNKAT